MVGLVRIDRHAGSVVVRALVPDVALPVLLRALAELNHILALKAVSVEAGGIALTADDLHLLAEQTVRRNLAVGGPVLVIARVLSRTVHTLADALVQSGEVRVHNHALSDPIFVRFDFCHAVDDEFLADIGGLSDDVVDLEFIIGEL